MFRALFSVAIVLLLSTIALLLYANYAHDDKATSTAEVGLKTSPPPVAPKADPPPTPAPLPAPTPAPAPVPVKPEPPVAVAPPIKETKPKAEPRKLEPGPGERTYVVEAGDTLWSISKKNYGTPDYYNKIAALNRLTQKDRIRPGQVLIVPDLPYTAPENEESATTTTKDDATSNEALADDHDHENDNLVTRKTPAPANNDDANTDPDVQPPTLSIQVERK